MHEYEVTLHYFTLILEDVRDVRNRLFSRFSKEERDTMVKVDVDYIGEGNFYGLVNRNLEYNISELEASVLQLYSKGFNIKQISLQVYHSRDTVSKNLRRAKEKLGAGTYTEAVANAIRAGIIV